jgi:hypothetical protein
MMEWKLAKMDSLQEEMKVYNKKTEAILHEMKSWRKETTACQEAMETCLESKEPTSRKMRVHSDAWGGP